MADGKRKSLVDSAWLARHLDDEKVVVIDVAGLGQDNLQTYREGHVPGAFAWKWKEMLWDDKRRDFPDPGEFARRLGRAGIAEDTLVVFYGAPVQFGVYAWWTFRYCGHRNVAVLDGGRKAWKAAGLPLVREEPQPRAPAEHGETARDESMRVLREAVLQAVNEGNEVILDGRSPEEYRGERVGGPGGPDVGAVRYGRIPRARHIHYADLLDEQERFKTPDQLREAFESRGARPENRIVTYCRMSHRATVLYFVLTELLGYENVRVYDGSWTEWGNLVGVPVER
jgi:thiosulfate/3-mercaptopyruvate sulfurtransferase